MGNIAFPNKVSRLTVILVLLLAMLCRGIWSTALAEHESAPLVDTVTGTLNHGHYHVPTLDHLHDSSSGLADEDHPLVHVVSAIDFQGVLPPFPVTPVSVASILQPDYIPKLTVPSPQTLYRPPRPTAVA